MSTSRHHPEVVYDYVEEVDPNLVSLSSFVSAPWHFSYV